MFFLQDVILTRKYFVFSDEFLYRVFVLLDSDVLVYQVVLFL